MEVNKKVLVKDELDYCKKALSDELNSVSAYQSQYLDWINSRKEIVNSMRKNLPVGEFTDILDFCEYRNEFLCKKSLQINRYLSLIKKMVLCISSADEEIDFVELEEIETKLIMMLTSLGLSVPFEVFGEF